MTAEAPIMKTKHVWYFFLCFTYPWQCCCMISAGLSGSFSCSRNFLVFD
jgi:hypothetical protein